MFEDLNKDPGEEGLRKAARIFDVLAVLAGIAFVINGVQVFTSREGSIIQFVTLPLACGLSYFTARGIEAQRPWAKWLGYAQGFLSLFNFPIGTIIGLFVLVYIFRASKSGLFVSKNAVAAPTASQSA